MPALFQGWHHHQKRRGTLRSISGESPHWARRSRTTSHGLRRGVESHVVAVCHSGRLGGSPPRHGNLHCQLLQRVADWRHVWWAVQRVCHPDAVGTSRCVVYWSLEELCLSVLQDCCYVLNHHVMLSTAPAIGGWNQTCGKELCWTSTPESVAPRLNKMLEDGIQEAAVFRLLQVAGSEMPQSFWWPALRNYSQGIPCS